MIELNNLVQGVHCRVMLSDRSYTEGAFLGIEVVHGDWSILIESADRTHSIPVRCIDEIE